MERTLKTIALSIAIALSAAACSQADIASNNLSEQADNFEVLRRVVFYNSITDTVMLEVTGFCSLGNNDTSAQRTVTCKLEDTPDGEPQFVKHFLGRSDNVTFFAEQVDPASVSTDFYRVRFRPQTILPDLHFG